VLQRTLAATIRRACRTFPSVVVTGARQTPEMKATATLRPAHAAALRRFGVLRGPRPTSVTCADVEEPLSVAQGVVGRGWVGARRPA
jgi:hypothetical protein